MDNRYSTSMDIRRISPLITGDVMQDERLWEFCSDADSFMVTALLPNYLSESALTDTPYASTPVPDENNKGTGRLLGDLIVVSALAITEQWEIRFTTSSAFVVTGSSSGSQGTGNVSTEFTSTNERIVIPIAAWSNTDRIQADDIFRFATCNVFRILRTISAYKATALALQSLFSQNLINSEVESGKWMKHAEDILNKMTGDDPQYKLSTFPNRNLDPIGIAYNIDEFGMDVSDYADNELQ